MITVTYLPLFVTMLFRGMPGIWKGRHRLILCWLVCMQALFPGQKTLDSILKFFQVDRTGIWRMTSSARYFKEGVGSSRPNWRWIICFLERPKVNTSCKALVKRCSWL